MITWLTNNYNNYPMSDEVKASRQIKFVQVIENVFLQKSNRK